MWIWNALRLPFDPAMHAERDRAPGRARSRIAHPIALAAIGSCLGACQGIDPDDPSAATDPSAIVAARHDEHGRRCNWEQWGGSPGHTGAACEEVEHFDRISAHLTFDPFLNKELADAEIQVGEPDLFSHFQTPLLVDNHVYMEFKSGTYTSCDSVPAGAPCGILAWNSQVWTERAFHWSHDRLVADWTFASDWKPEPGLFAFWEPVFHAIVVGEFVYVPGASGSLHKLDRRTGHEIATIRLPGVGDDPNTFVAGGIASDVHGNLYYNALALSPAGPRRNPRGAWLVKVRPDNTVAMAEFSTIAVGAPAATDACIARCCVHADQHRPPRSAILAQRRRSVRDRRRARPRPRLSDRAARLGDAGDRLGFDMHRQLASPDPARQRDRRHPEPRGRVAEVA